MAFRRGGEGRSGKARPGLDLLVGSIVLAFHLALVPLYSMRFLPSGDEPEYLLLAISLIQERDLDLTDNFQDRDYRVLGLPYLQPHRAPCPSPALRSWHGIGLPLLILPGYRAAGLRGARATMAMVTALLAVALAWLLRPWLGPKAAAVVAILTGLSPPLSTFGTLVFPGPAIALLGLGAFLISRGFGRPGVGSSLLAGCLVAALPWFHTRAILLGCVPLARLLWRRPTRRALAALLLPPVVSGLAYGIYQQWVYGDLLWQIRCAGAGGGVLGWHTLRAMAGLLLDRAHGLLPIAPVYAVAIPGVWLLVRRSCREALWIALHTLPLTLLSASWVTWWGGWCPAGRYLVPVIPYLALLAGLGFRESPRLLRGFWWALAALPMVVAPLWIRQPLLLYSHPGGESRLLERSLGSRVLHWLPSLSAGGAGARPWLLVLAWSLVLAAAATLVVSRRRWGSPLLVLCALLAALMAWPGVQAEDVARRAARDTPLSSQPATLIEPLPGARAAPGDLVFRWEAVPGAGRYAVTLRYPDGQEVSGEAIAPSTELTVPAAMVVNLPSGEYAWWVTALRDLSQGPPSEQRTLQLVEASEER